ncbi:MAG: TonB-dependent receptor, partial [Acidobacteria bacterium]|nr:TonB-dependent receptor [Acidobacteriota bacterium]
GYYQWGQKIQANRLPQGTYTYTDPDQTFRQDSGSWVWKGEWNGTVSDKLYVEARYGDFGYYFPQIANSDTGYWFRDTGLLTLEGSPQRQQNDRDRKQVTAAATYFVDSSKGSHTFKFGAELLKEKQWVGFEDGVGGNQDLQYANGRSSQIVFWFPTARSVGSLKTDNNGDTYVGNNLDVFGAFVNDTWSVGRATVNMGVRWDRYNNWLPDQSQVAFTHGIAKLAIADQDFAKTDVNTWNSFAPRIGFVYDLTGDGKTVVKANYGLYWHNPGVGLSASVNPNQSSKNVTYAWNDINGDKRWQPGEEGASPTASNLAGAITKADGLKQPYTHEAGVFLERQITEMIGSRVGFVYKTEDDLFESYQVNRPASVYTVPFTFVDIGVDGVRGSGDDKNLTLLGMPAADATKYPVNQVISNAGQFGRYKTVEASVTKRYSHKWSASMGGSYTIRNNFPTGSFPQTPNHPGSFSRDGWDFKATASYDAPLGVRISPVLRHQAGTPFARTISVAASAGTAFGLVVPATTIYADAFDANRSDNITVFDIRAERTFELGKGLKIRGFFDLFNITNSHASETVTVATGTTYLRPAAILAPITSRVGMRLLW